MLVVLSGPAAAAAAAAAAGAAAGASPAPGVAVRPGFATLQLCAPAAGAPAAGAPLHPLHPDWVGVVSPLLLRRLVLLLVCARVAAVAAEVKLVELGLAWGVRKVASEADAETCWSLLLAWLCYRHVLVLIHCPDCPVFSAVD
jgi:hypothetical protein